MVGMTTGTLGKEILVNQMIPIGTIQLQNGGAEATVRINGKKRLIKVYLNPTGLQPTTSNWTMMRM